MEKPKFKVYNTMTRQKEVFEPIDPPKVGMYVCGVTAYDYSHIGHARAYVAFDVLYRYLKYLGYDVNYVRNFTDVDDKIIHKANEIGEEPLTLSRRFCEEFRLDMAALQCLPVNAEPYVSTHINEIISMIEEIEDKGFAYEIEGDVFFSVDKFPEYGRLSGRKLEDNRAGERVSVDSRKKNPADFALWKSAKPGEISWESCRWGHGRPGWHIECSAMSKQHLGPGFDIHGGGQDLIFPHHENEIAQSQAACAESNIKYWLHNGFVNVNNEKMSKSLGNFFTIREVIQQYHPLALRYFLMTTHYRSPVNYSLDQLEHASDRLFYIYQTLADCETVLSRFKAEELSGKIKDDVQLSLTKFRDGFDSSMADDLLTPPILSSFSDLLKLINNYTSLLKVRKQQQQQKVVAQNLVALEMEIRDVLEILGLLPYPSTLEVLQELKSKALTRAELSEEEVQKLIKERDLARKSKDFKVSDEIRARLDEVGIKLMDNTPEGTVWRPSIPHKYNQYQSSGTAATDAK